MDVVDVDDDGLESGARRGGWVAGASHKRLDHLMRNRSNTASVVASEGKGASLRTSARALDHSGAVRAAGEEDGEEDEHLGLLRRIVVEGTSEKDGWENGDHRRWLRLHLNCFPARSAVSWMVRKGYASSREHAVTLGRALVEAGEIYHVSLEREFNDNDDLFRFVRQSVLVPSTRVGNDNSLLSSPVVTEDGHVVYKQVSESNESHLVALATKMAHRESGIRRRTIRRWGFPQHLAFTGEDIVDYLKGTEEISGSDVLAYQAALQLMERGLFHRIDRPHSRAFKWSRNEIYRFVFEDLDFLTKNFDGDKDLYRALMKRSLRGENVELSAPMFRTLFFFSSDGFANRLFDAIGSSISIANFNDALLSIRATSDQVAQAKADILYKIMDVDNKGHISRDDFYSAVAECCDDNRLGLKKDVIESLSATLMELFPPNCNCEQFSAAIQNNERMKERLQSLTVSLRRHAALESGLSVTPNTSANEVPTTLPPMENLVDPPFIIPRLYRAVRNEGFRYLFLFFYLAVNIVLFVVGYVIYGVGGSFQPLRSHVGWTLPLAKACSFTLYLNVPFCFFTMCRRFLTWLRSLRLFQWLPFDDARNYHRLSASLIAIAAVIHSLSHVRNFALLAGDIVTDDAIDLPFYAPADPGFFFYLFATIAGITGLVMCTSLMVLIISAQQVVRNWFHELFFSLHHLALLFLVCFIVHGSQALITFPIGWIVILIPMFLYLTQRGRRLVARDSSVISVKRLGRDVVWVKLKRPSGFEFQAGQYAFVNWANATSFLKALEWHPFAISSAPDEDHLGIYMRVLGDWTREFYLTAPDLPVRIRIDGAYGQSIQSSRQFKTLMLIATGVGITPLISVLKMVSREMRMDCSRVRQVYVFWLCRSPADFHWAAPIVNEVLENTPDPSKITVLTYLTSATAQSNIRNFMLRSAIEAYWEKAGFDVVTNMTVLTNWGRPDWGRALTLVKAFHRGENIGVYFCGNRKLNRLLREVCERYSDRCTNFVYHKETY